MTVSEIVDKVLSLAFPKKFGHSMLGLKEHHVRHGLTEIQRRVEGFRVANTTILEATAEYMVSGASIVPAPQGFIEQVAVGNTNCMTTFCVVEPYPKVQQRQADWARVNLCGDPTVAQPCFPQAHVVWARDRGDIMIYPWVPAPWQIGIRWNGIVRDWGETNDVWWGESAIEALRLYVLWKTAVDDNCDQNRIGIAKTDFVDEAAKLKTEDFQIRNPVPLPTYIAEMLSQGWCMPVPTTTPPPTEPPPVEPPVEPPVDDMEVNELTVTGGITLGGVRIAAWPEDVGSAEGIFLDYNFNPNPPPPASGQIRRDNSDGTLAKALLVHKLGNGGSDNTKVLNKIPTGSLVYLQDWNDSTRWVRYITSGQPALVSDAYYAIPVDYHSDSGVILLTQRIAMYLAAVTPP